MARSKNIENMSFAELPAMQARIERAKIEKQSSERAALKQKLTDMAKEHGFDIHELLGRGGKGCWAYPGPFNWSPGRLRTARRSCYTFCMSSLLEQVVEDLRSLSREEQDRATEVLQAFLDGLQDDFRLMA